MNKWIEHVKKVQSKTGLSWKESLITAKKSYKKVGGMEKLPEASLHDISAYLRNPYVHDEQLRMNGYTPFHISVEHGDRERQIRNHRNIENLARMNENRQGRIREAHEFIDSPIDRQLAEIQSEEDIRHVNEMYRTTGRPIPYELIQIGIGGRRKRKGVR
jgi:hypothetical protein